MAGTIDWDELVRLCKRNRPDAQHKVYNLLSSKMFSVCLRYAKDRTEAEDILQEGFLRTFTKIGQFDFKGSFEGWVRRVMVNCALERLRKQNLLYSVSDMGEYDTHLSSDDVLSEISAGELMQMVQDLSPQYRMVFNLYAIEGYTHQEIGQMLNITESTSKSNLSRARNILQEKVEALFGLRRHDIKLLNR